MDWIDRLVPARHRGTPEHRSNRLLVGCALGLASILTITFAIRLLLLPLPTGVTFLMLGSITTLLLSILLPWFGAPVVLACRLVVWTYCGLFTAVLYPTGGMAAPGAVTAPVAPLLAHLLLGRREAVRVFFLILGILTAYVVFPPESPWSSQTEREIVIRGFLIAVATALVTLFAMFYDRERLEALDHLAHSRSLYQRLFGQTKDAVILSTPNGELLDANQAALELYAAPDRESMLARPAQDFYALPDQRDQLLEILDEEGFAQAYDSQHRTLAGDLRTVQGTTSTLRDEAGRVEMMMTILRDVTERRRMAQEREDTLRQLARKNTELERFAATVSHDLKSPLLTVSGFLDVLRRDLEGGEQQRWPRDLERIEGAVGAMRTLIDDLLVYARLGDRPPTLEPVALGALIRQVGELLTGRLAGSQARLEIAPDLPVVQGDATLLRTVFQNLLDNAAKFSARRDPGPTPLIQVGWRDLDGRSVECWVEDSGPGIPSDQLERIFDLFHRLDTRHEGTGIGLASARRAVDLMGGELRADSVHDGPETGAKFSVRLPRARTLDTGPDGDDENDGER